MSDLDQMQADLIGRIADADLAQLEDIRVSALGKSGSVTALLKTLGGMSPEQRQVEGPRIQGLREAVSDALTSRKAGLERAALDARLASETLDMTLPADIPPTGTIHPVSQVMDELAEIFADLGFAVATGPETTRFAATLALAALPDPRALQVYLRGLADKSPDLRKASAGAVAAIRVLAEPTLIRLAERRELPSATLPELRRIFNPLQPVVTWHLAGPFARNERPPVPLNQAVDVASPLVGPGGTSLPWKEVRPIR